MLKITVYSTTTCPHCINLKRWLDSKSIKYDGYNVDENPIAAANMERISKQNFVPFSTIEFSDGKVEHVAGFDRAKFEAALEADK